MSDSLRAATNNGDSVEAMVRLNTAGLGTDLCVEMVVNQEVDGEVKFFKTIPFDVESQNGDIVTYRMKSKLKNSGIFRYAFRVYPWNVNLPHRQDFAYVKWI